MTTNPQHSAHTPGPFRTNDALPPIRDGALWETAILSGWETVAMVKATTKEQCEANADLLAAAPELLAALEHIANDNENYAAIEKIARAAILKAKGQPNAL